MDKNLTKFLKKKQKQSGTPINWDDRRDKYIAAVQALHGRIGNLLAEPIRQNMVRLQQRKKDLTENYIGTYSIDDLSLVIGDEQVRFSPRGRNIVGAEGRVDVVGERGEAILILGHDEKWGLVESREPKLKVAPLNEATLAEALQLVMRE